MIRIVSLREASGREYGELDYSPVAKTTSASHRRIRVLNSAKGAVYIYQLYSSIRLYNITKRLDPLVCRALRWPFRDAR
jgi:hypothetical protein